MKVIALDIANVKRITAVHLDPDGKSVILAGKNAQGKSSILDAIFYALGGGKALPPKAVKTGEEKGEISVRIGNPEKEYTVKRTLTAAGGGTLTVTSSDGFRAPSPQALLDDLTSGGIAFDPLEFVRLRPAAQREALCQIVGIDTAEHDRVDAQLRREREDCGRDGKKAAGYAAELPQYDDAPDADRTAGELLERIQQAEAANRNRDSIIREGIAAAKDADAFTAEAARLRALADEADAKAAAARAHAVELRAKVTDEIDTAPMRADLDSLESANAKARANAAKAAAIKRADAMRADYAALTARIAENATAKESLIAGAAFPIPGLALGADGVEFNGVPLSQASQAEQLRVSVAIAMARNPKLRVALIREAAVLDSDSMIALMEAAEAHDVQLFVERVGTDEPGAIVIEDGHVRGE
jgi:hypothetical protein